MGLCHRCDYRARYLEDGSGPRSECKSNGAVRSCYMYRPVMPLVLAPNEGDDRPLVAGIFSSRSHSIRVINEEELKLCAIEVTDGYILFYAEKPLPKEPKMAKQIKAGKKTIAPKPASSGPVGKVATTPLRGK